MNLRLYNCIRCAIVLLLAGGLALSSFILIQEISSNSILPDSFRANYKTSVSTKSEFLPFDSTHFTDQCAVDIVHNMPIHSVSKLLVAHHWDARTGKWNEHDRWRKQHLLAPCVIYYVGANTHGRDGLRLQNEYACVIHVFEPVPVYFTELLSNFKNVPRSHLHNFGLGSSSRAEHNIPLLGESTFAMVSHNSKPNQLKQSSTSIQIKDFVQAIHDLNTLSIDLLHVNCEGCEWELLEAVIRRIYVQVNIRIFQFSSHYFPHIENITGRYCYIRSQLQRTHDLIFGQYFGWERWERNLTKFPRSAHASSLKIK